MRRLFIVIIIREQVSGKHFSKVYWGREGGWFWKIMIFIKFLKFYYFDAVFFRGKILGKICVANKSKTEYNPCKIPKITITRKKLKHICLRYRK